MRKFGFILVLLIVCTSFIDSEREWGSYKALFISRADLEKSVSYEAKPRELINPGKIYYMDPYIYINEKYKGVHVVNNSNPASPQREGFIYAPGCVDMAMKGSTLYLDNAVDLVAFDVVAKTVTKRIVNVFPELTAPDNLGGTYYERAADLVLVEWRKK